MTRTPRALSLTLLTAILLLAALPALASVAGVHSLQIPPGARANGLGEASVAIANDATAPWWNPAGLGFMRGRTLGLMHSQLVPDLADDIYYEYFGWIDHMEGWGSYSVNVVYLSYGKSVITEDSPEELGTFNSYEVVPSIAYGVPLSENLAIGLGLKYARVDLAPEYAILARSEDPQNVYAGSPCIAGLPSGRLVVSYEWFRPAPHKEQVPDQTDTSRRMSRELKRRGFKFVGPVICYAYMQAAGLVNDHLTSCFRYKELKQTK